jgi:SNF2 family DNA or RNA helicase
MAAPHVAIRLKRVFPKIAQGERGVLELSDAPEIARDLEWFLERHPLEMTHGDRAYLVKRAGLYRERADALEGLLSGKLDPRPCPLAIPLRKYQEIAADLTIRFGGLLLADEMGLGKTASAIGVLSQVEARPALVVTLTSLPEQWRDEINRFAPSTGLPPMTCGSPRGRRRGNSRSRPLSCPT